MTSSHRVRAVAATFRGPGAARVAPSGEAPACRTGRLRPRFLALLARQLARRRDHGNHTAVPQEPGRAPHHCKSACHARVPIMAGAPRGFAPRLVRRYLDHMASGFAWGERGRTIPGRYRRAQSWLTKRRRPLVRRLRSARAADVPKRSPAMSRTTALREIGPEVAPSFAPTATALRSGSDGHDSLNSQPRDETGALR